MEFKDNGVVCVMPWLHLHVSTTGNAYPCCVSDYSQPVGNIRNDKINTIANSEKMCSIRKNMLEGKQSSICSWCYQNEEVSNHSFRKTSIENFGHHFDDLVYHTEKDGSIPEFRMRYLDVRFSNICNFKCRTCGVEFSSQWAQENKNLGLHDSEIIQKADQTNSTLEQILEHVPNMEEAYFAGGEPLITDEHYIILEELIRTGAYKNVKLRYSTNMSNLKYKKYDLFEMWKWFPRLEISVSVDHYGERAEYIRTGTDWGVIENNIKDIRQKLPHNIDWQFNTVVSIFNYNTLGKVYEYLVDAGLKAPTDNVTVSNCLTPTEFNPQSLPRHLKDIANKHVDLYAKRFKVIKKDWSYQALESAYKFVNKKDLWEQNKDLMQKNILRLDTIRNTQFVDTFPELADLMKDQSDMTKIHTKELEKWIKTTS
mgnify:CR=1 FL=1